MTNKTDAECEAAIKQFAEILNCNEAYAHSVLQDVDYDLEQGIAIALSAKETGTDENIINSFVENDESSRETAASVPSDQAPEESSSPKEAKPALKRKAESDERDSESKRPRSVVISPDVDQLPGDQNDLDADKPSTSGLNLIPSSSVTFDEKDKPLKQTRISETFAPKTSQPTSDAFPPDLTIFSFNIDGIGDRALRTRFLAVLQIVAKVNPDIIFFQEFVQPLEQDMRKLLSPMYHIYTGFGGSCPYYTVTLVAKCIKVQHCEVVNFGYSEMGRNMLCVEGKWKNLNVRLINSHLESCYTEYKKRKDQFSEAMAKLKEYSETPNVFAIFGGDLNVRDGEVSNVPKGVVDAWVAAGSNNDFKYTWDTKLNDSHEFKKNVRHRFDRFYVKSPYSKLNFWLEGKQRIKQVNCFPSDHFAIVCKFSAPREE